MLSLLIPEEIFHGEKNHRLFYSSKIRNSVVVNAICIRSSLGEKTVGTIFYGEIKFYGRTKYRYVGNGDGISGVEDRMASGSGIDEARPRHKIVWILESRQSLVALKYIYIYICMKCWRSNKLGNGLHRQVMVDWISRKLVSLDEILLNLAARTGFR